VTLEDRAKAIQLLILDVDGVLTDGTLYYSDAGIETKRFHVRDGSGLKLWQLTGKQAAIISGRTSQAVANRAMELAISPVIQGCGADKRPAFESILKQTGLSGHQIAVIGDDVPDMPLFKRCGLAIAVGDACRDAKLMANYVTSANGGLGAVRDAIEWLLGLTGEWSPLIAKYQQ
jgi:3-deoxy-D-manno-octulosonate 8-phosphate phosphatase (KDO 8-P phosphatase)